MEFPNLFEVRKEFSQVIEDLDFFIEVMSTKNAISFSEYSSQLETINIELIKMMGKINGLIAGDAISNVSQKGSIKVNRRYSKAHEKLRKTLIKTIIEPHDIEKKHLKYGLTFWESEFQKGKMRKDLIDHFRKVSKQLKKIRQNL